MSRPACMIQAVSMIFESWTWISSNWRQGIDLIERGFPSLCCEECCALSWDHASWGENWIKMVIYVRISSRSDHLSTKVMRCDPRSGSNIPWSIPSLLGLRAGDQIKDSAHLTCNVRQNREEKCDGALQGEDVIERDIGEWSTGGRDGIKSQGWGGHEQGIVIHDNKH